MFQEWEKLEEDIGTTDASFLGLCFSQKHPGISNGRWLDSQRTSSQGPCLNPGGLGEACQRLNGCNVPHRVIKAWWMVEITSRKPRGRVSRWCCSWYVPEGSIPCLCCPCPTPFGWGSWFPEFPAMWLIGGDSMTTEGLHFPFTLCTWKYHPGFLGQDVMLGCDHRTLCSL